ncbi:MAG: Gfo/Idh/MocA family oxidoreductase [Dehalococcoidia bacterium]
MADTIRVGIVGANAKESWASRAHLPAFKGGIPGAELAAVGTTRQESAEESAQVFGAKLAFWDHRKLVESPDVDVVAVSVKLPGHYQIAMDALNAGKHVYVEWPLGTNTAQAEEMATLASQKGVRTAVGLQSRHSAAYRQMRKLIADGYIGEVLTVNLRQIVSGVLGRPSGRMWMRDKEAGANTLSIPFGHAVDGLTTVAGDVAALSALVTTQVKQWRETDTGKVYDVTSPDQVMVSGRMHSGAALSMHVGSVARQGAGHRMEVHGTEGTLAIEGTGSPHNFPSRVLGAQGDAKELQEIQIEDDGWVREADLKGAAVNIGRLWKAFGDAIRDGKPFDADFAAAVRHHKLMDTVQRASDTGQRQAVA